MDAGALPLLAATRDEAAALDAACNSLSRARPHFSAKRVVTFVQGGVLLLAAGGFAYAAVTAPAMAWAALFWSLSALFFCMIALRLAAAAAALSPAWAPMRRWGQELPAYTLLCPLFMEADVIGDFTDAIRRIDYPADKLDVKLILEEDDVETIAAAGALRLPPSFEIIVTPSAEPQTKPKALNYALQFARGRFVAVYDAEDAPHPGQLKAALDAFAQGGEKMACVQAPLVIGDTRGSWIGGQFAAEYAVQFGAVLPFLARFGLPLPLGGTSNHFRREALEACGGWDPHNVTEDADIGYRLARDGWRTGVIAPPTEEEAPMRHEAWRKQRTRWIKGHLQTWLVHMRNPLRSAREMGWAGFASMQIVLFGGIAAALLHGPIIALLIGDALFGWGLIGPVGAALAIGGYATSLYCAVATAAMLDDWRVARAALTMPLYWPLSTWAAGRAVIELFTKPFYWDKTEHGLSKQRA